MTEDKTNQAGPPNRLGSANALTLTIDYAHYQKDLDDADLSDAEKQQFLEALWSIIVAFVDLGFGVHPVQHAIEKSCENSCEQSSGIRSFITAECATVVSSVDTDIVQTDTSGGQAGSQERGAK